MVVSLQQNTEMMERARRFPDKEVQSGTFLHNPSGQMSGQTFTEMQDLEEVTVL